MLTSHFFLGTWSLPGDGWGKARSKKRDISDEDKNLKHRCRSWSKVVKESPVAQGDAVASGTYHSQPSVSVPATNSSRLRTVKFNDLNPNEVYSSEEVIALLAAVRNSKTVSKRDDTVGWTEHKSRRTIKNEKKLEGKFPRKRKFSPQLSGNDGCWVCGKKGHFKDECPYLRCRFARCLDMSLRSAPRSRKSCG